MPKDMRSSPSISCSQRATCSMNTLHSLRGSRPRRKRRQPLIFESRGSKNETCLVDEMDSFVERFRL
nr:hypothetical protein I308_03000 [Cryptococcus tetragattii IND107]